ncbi:unnamed protein product [Amoebophrya sp. A120]|nr:unnamed protein product [Amoebophrya sp. A120]|eukprot:GSA120T00024340001.1
MARVRHGEVPQGIPVDSAVPLPALPVRRVDAPGHRGQQGAGPAPRAGLHVEERGADGAEFNLRPGLDQHRGAKFFDDGLDLLRLLRLFRPGGTVLRLRLRLGQPGVVLSDTTSHHPVLLLRPAPLLLRRRADHPHDLPPLRAFLPTPGEAARNEFLGLHDQLRSPVLLGPVRLPLLPEAGHHGALLPANPLLFREVGADSAGNGQGSGPADVARDLHRPRDALFHLHAGLRPVLGHGPVVLAVLHRLCGSDLLRVAFHVDGREARGQLPAGDAELPGPVPALHPGDPSQISGAHAGRGQFCFHADDRRAHDRDRE